MRNDVAKFIEQLTAATQTFREIERRKISPRAFALIYSEAQDLLHEIEGYGSEHPKIWDAADNVSVT